MASELGRAVLTALLLVASCTPYEPLATGYSPPPVGYEEPQAPAYVPPALPVVVPPPVNLTNDGDVNDNSPPLAPVHRYRRPVFHQPAPSVPDSGQRSLSDRLRDGLGGLFGSPSRSAPPPPSNDDDCAGRWWDMCHFL